MKSFSIEKIGKININNNKLEKYNNKFKNKSSKNILIKIIFFLKNYYWNSNR